MTTQDQNLVEDKEELAEIDAELAEKLKALQPKPNYIGAPETLEAAIERIVELELRLGDLHRAAEIATVVRDFSLIEGQMPEAGKALESKIVIEYPQSAGGPGITVITGQVEQ
jgi:hypothetical protein